MKITDIKRRTLQHPTLTQPTYRLKQVPGLRRIQYTHTPLSAATTAQMQILDVETDEGITGRIAPVSITNHQLDILKTHAVGESPFARERLFQMLHKGTRWVYQEPGWFGEFDNCLWDIAGKAAGLPVHALIGRVRDRLPVYLTDHELTPQGYLDHIERGRTFGVNAYKLHTYRGGKRDIPLLTDIRKAVGDDYDLLNDPVCSYNLREAIEVGRAMEELDYVWLEEPMHEQKMNQYQELCRTLTIPIMATERLCHDMDLSAQWLIQGATDRLRARTNHGLTQVSNWPVSPNSTAQTSSSTVPAASTGSDMPTPAAASTTPTFSNSLADPAPATCAPKAKNGASSPPPSSKTATSPRPTAPAGAPSGTKTASAHSPWPPIERTRGWKHNVANPDL